MGGTVKGKVDCVTTVAPNGNQEWFVGAKDFFDALETAGYGVIHASHFGSGGTGFDYHDGANPCGENAWFVFEWAVSTARPGGGSALGKVYTLVQFADGTAFGTSPGNPGLMNGGTADGVAFQTAFREDGGDPWNGGSAALGADAKGATVWTAGGSALHILDVASTATAGSHDTNFENMLSPGDASTASRFQFVADEDSFACFFDQGNNGTYGMYYAGLFDPLPGVTASYPMICLTYGTLPLAINSAIGSVAGSSAREGGLVASDGAGPKVGMCRMDRMDAVLDDPALQPNPQTAALFDEVDIPVYLYDAANSLYGWMGNISFLRAAYNVGTHESNGALDRAAFGSGTVATLKVTAPWGSVSPPGTGATRAGRDF